ncbi:hypothetical protein EMIT0P100_190050 [Pseudomonas sp. IT-P100]
MNEGRFSEDRASTADNPVTPTGEAGFGQYSYCQSPPVPMTMRFIISRELFHCHVRQRFVPAQRRQ